MRVRRRRRRKDAPLKPWQRQREKARWYLSKANGLVQKMAEAAPQTGVGLVTVDAGELMKLRNLVNRACLVVRTDGHE